MIGIDQIKTFIADIARPFAIISTSAAASFATISISARVTGGESGAIFLTAVYAGVGALYVGKAFENTRIAGHNAEVEKVRAQQASPPPDRALEPGDAGELPLDQRVRP